MPCGILCILSCAQRRSRVQNLQRVSLPPPFLSLPLLPSAPPWPRPAPSESCCALRSPDRTPPRYEPVTGERDGVSHAARGARPYANVVQSPWTRDGGGMQVRRISSDAREAPVCPKGQWLQDGCGADEGSGGQSSATADNVCQPCQPDPRAALGNNLTTAKKANSHYDFPMDPFQNTCPWTCNAGSLSPCSRPSSLSLSLLLSLPLPLSPPLPRFPL